MDSYQLAEGSQETYQPARLLRIFRWLVRELAGRLTVYRISKLQKRAVRVIKHSKYNAHTKPIFKALKLLNVEDMLKLNELKFYYKYENNKLPKYFSKTQFVLNLNSDPTNK